MTTKTAKERVMEAVTKGLEIVATLNAARGRLLIAKQEEDAVRLADRTKEIAAQAAAEQAQAEQAAQANFQRLLAEAQKPRDAAQAVFERASSALHQAREARFAEAKEKAQATILKAQREQETKQAIAKAGVHTVQQEVANIEASIDHYARQVEQQLGVNLKQLLAIAKE